VTPENAVITIREGVLRVAKPVGEEGRRAPIDLFLLSLAEDQGENAACIIVSGAGHDGTLGLRAIKEHGGLTMAQSAETAAHDSMLHSAVKTGLVDFQLPVEEIPAKLVQYFDHLDGMQQQPKEQLEPSADQLRRICARVQAATGHDFAEYKDRTLIRRIQRRMHVHQLGGVDDYIELLERGRREADLLLKDLMIGVTQFFRDPEAFEVLAQDVIPKLLEGKTAQDEIRLWVAGCATGEEAYSVAILVQEALDGVAGPPTVQIFASDIDQDALQFARTGRYPSLIERDVSSARLERFFVKEDGTFRVRDVLRESCVFAQHNVLRDPPFSRLHLICCRNLLIYLGAKMQARLLPVLHYGLQDGGYLFLGPSEGINQHTRLFDPVDKKHRVFKRRADGLHHLPKFPIGEMPQVPRLPTPAPPPEGRRSPVDVIGRMAEAVLAKDTPAYVIINEHFDIVSASRRTGRFLELAEGRPELNVLSMART
jgi:two-component system CheB/CheR fusion protein